MRRFLMSWIFDFFRIYFPKFRMMLGLTLFKQKKFVKCERNLAQIMIDPERSLAYFGGLVEQIHPARDARMPLYA